MATSPTTNPVPSEAYADLRYNAGVLDTFLNSQSSTFTDRLGNEKETLKSITVNAASAQQIEAAKDAAEAAELHADQSATDAANSAATAATSAGSASGSATSATNSATAAAASASTATTQASAAAASAATAASYTTGVTDGSSAAAGKVGQMIEANASAVALTSGAVINITSISLPAGEWDVYGEIQLVSSASGVMTAMSGGVSTTSATDAGFPYKTALSFNNNSTVAQFTTPRRFFQRTTTGTVYLVASTVFGSGTVAAAGYIHARRIR